VIVSAVRNEAKYLGRTLESVIGQTLRPLKWVIVDDGSSDSTGQLADNASAGHNWIHAIHRADRGFRKSGAGVMEAFYEGYGMVENGKWEFVAKLDGDLSFGPNAFQIILDAFSRDHRLGISGGDILQEKDGREVIESKNDPDFHVRGATKVYRRACWDAMGGILPVTGWDTLDEVKANMLGWQTRRIPEARFFHLRPTGGADGGWRNAFKNGRGSYISGYHPIYLLSKCIKRLPSRPFLIQSLGLFAGFFSSYFTKAERIKDRDLIRYLRKQQLKRLVGLPTTWQ